MAHLELTPTSVVAGGAAMARDPEGRVIFVDGALPGERVVAAVVESRRDFARAAVVEVVDPSPDRVAPPCAALAAGCGGCTWQHVAATAQSRLKADIVRDALRRIARVDGPAIEVTAPRERPLRTTARLGVDGRGRAGHRPRRGHGVVPASTCLAVHPLVEELVVDGRYPGALEVTLRVGVASGDRLVWPRPPGAQPEVPAGVRVAGGPRGGTVRESVAGRWFRISAGSFFQPGPVAAAALVDAVDAAIGPALPAGGRLVDLYGGVGLFASTIGSRRRASVTLVEQSRPAVADSAANLADLDAVVVEGEVGRWPGGPADVVVADPARSGLGRPGAAALARARAPRAVLVSCDPASFARDVVLLGIAGYRLTGVTVVDAFPDTFHVEAVGRFDLR